MTEVSIVMPVRDVAVTVGPAVRSIQAQTFGDWECVIVDDGSIDATVSIVRGLAGMDRRIRLIEGRAAEGIARRLNQAVAAADGTFVARMDGDDVCYPDRLAAQLRFLVDHPDVDVVGAGAMVFHGAGVARGPRRCAGAHRQLTADVMTGIPMMHPTWLGKREWFVSHPYDPSARGWEDQELLLRANETSTYAAIPDLLIGYREEHIKLGRSLRIRVQQSRYVLGYGLQRGRPGAALAAGAVRGMKAVRDVLAVTAGMQDAVLRARTEQPTPDEVAEWNRVWTDVANQ